MALCTRNSRHYPCSTLVFATLGYAHAVWSDQAASSPPGGDYPIGSPAFFHPMLQALTGSGCLPSASVARRRSDGRSIIYSSDSKGQFDLYRRSADGTGAEELLYAEATLKVP